MRSGRRVFVAGHDPELDGRLVYRGRIGESVHVTDVGRALRLATQNALAAARDATGSLERLRCVVLTAFVWSVTPDGLDPVLLEDSLSLLAAALPASGRPAVWLRPANGLAAGMPVEIELMLEIVRGRARAASAVRRRGTGAPGAARRPRRSGARTS